MIIMLNYTASVVWVKQWAIGPSFILAFIQNSVCILVDLWCKWRSACLLKTFHLLSLILDQDTQPFLNVLYLYCQLFGFLINLRFKCGIFLFKAFLCIILGEFSILSSFPQLYLIIVFNVKLWHVKSLAVASNLVLHYFLFLSQISFSIFHDLLLYRLLLLKSNILQLLLVSLWTV